MDSFRMNLRRVLVVTLIMLLILGSARNLFAAEVKIVQGKLFVNGEPFTIKGVGYSPVPAGVDPETTPPPMGIISQGSTLQFMTVTFPCSGRWEPIPSV